MPKATKETKRAQAMIVYVQAEYTRLTIKYNIFKQKQNNSNWNIKTNKKKQSKKRSIKSDN